jgi:UDP-N-acetylmuramate--alanine ligase
MVGAHNAMNALSVIAVADELDVPLDVVRSALKDFGGVQRRFTVRGEARGVTVVDDYGHHPAEIQATLNAAKRGFDRRLLVCFQPHRYTRTQALLREFFTAFYEADVLFVTEIYPAGEAPIPGVSGRQIADGVAEHGHRGVSYVPRREELAAAAAAAAQPGDMILTLGAGDIWRTGEEILRRLEGV